MSYTPMSDLGQQGLFDITRTLLQQPDLASLCEALSQLVKRSALADNAAIVLWQAQTQRASYYASREKDTPIKYEDETVLAHGPVRSILSRPDTLHCSYEEFCETWPQLDAGGLYPKFGHYCLMPLAAEGHIFYDGVDLLSLSQDELRKYRGREIALIFQEPGRSFDPLQNIGSVFFETFRVIEPEISK